MSLAELSPEARAEKLQQVASRISAEAGVDPPDKEPDDKDKAPDGAFSLGDEKTDEPAAEVKQDDPEVSRAAKGGWKPKDAWVESGGDPEEWVPAKAFNKRGELFDSVRSLKKGKADTDAAMKALAEQNRKLAEALRKQSVDGLLKSRDEAIEQGDKDAVKKIDGRIKEVDEQFAQPAQDTIPAELSEWVVAHEWFVTADRVGSDNGDPEATRAAASYYGMLESKNPADVTGNIEKTDAYMKRRYPDLYPQEKAEKPAENAAINRVESPTRARVSGGPKKFTFNDLNDAQKDVCRKFERMGHMSRDEYIKQLADIGELK